MVQNILIKLMKVYFLKLRVAKPREDKMKEIFGPKSVLNNNFYPAKKGYYGM